MITKSCSLRADYVQIFKNKYKIDALCENLEKNLRLEKKERERKREEENDTIKCNEITESFGARKSIQNGESSLYESAFFEDIASCR